MVVDVDEFAGEAPREESRDEERHIAEALQTAVPIRGGGCFQCFSQHHDQRLEACAAIGLCLSGRLLVERIGAREQCQEIDDVVLGLIFDSEVLSLERAMQRIVKVLAQIRHRDDTG